MLRAMDGDDPIGEILIGAAVMDAADEALTGFGRRYPRTFGVARIVCGAFLLVVGVSRGCWRPSFSPTSCTAVKA